VNRSNSLWRDLVESLVSAKFCDVNIAGRKWINVIRFRIVRSDVQLQVNSIKTEIGLVLKTRVLRENNSYNSR